MRAIQIRMGRWATLAWGLTACRPGVTTSTAGPSAGASDAGAIAAGAESRRRLVVEDAEVRLMPRPPGSREYQLYVGLPAAYAEHPDRRYPVLYLCDGYWDFNLVKGFYGNLVWDQVVPEFLIVGFGYPGDKPSYDSLRRWDYTPVADTKPGPDAGASGHAAEFLATIEHEIIPFVEREYRADSSFRVLAGSSLGGLFTLYAAFSRPELFQAYIAPSPAVGWAGDWLFDYEDAFAKRGGSVQARLFMTGAADEWPDFLAAIRRFDARLRSRSYPGLVYDFRIIEGERHAGTKAESYNRGVRFAFAPRAPGSAR